MNIPHRILLYIHTFHLSYEWRINKKFPFLDFANRGSTSIKKNEIPFFSLSVCLSQVCLSMFAGSRRPLTGTAASLAFTYLTYALLPIRLREALLAGVILTVVHVACSIYWGIPTHVTGYSDAAQDALWTQVRNLFLSFPTILPFSF